MSESLENTDEQASICLKKETNQAFENSKDKFFQSASPSINKIRVFKREKNIMKMHIFFTVTITIAFIFLLLFYIQIKSKMHLQALQASQQQIQIDLQKQIQQAKILTTKVEQNNQNLVLRYKSAAKQKKKIQYHKKRIEFLIKVQKKQHQKYQNHKSQNNFKRKLNAVPAFLVKYNMNLTFMNQTQAVEDMKWDYERLDKKFHLSSYPKQLPMCVVVCGYRNNQNYRVEYNLNSIFWQNYTNFKVVYTDDFSQDGTQEILKSYFLQNNISPQKGVLILNDQRKHNLQNTYNGITSHCDDQAIVISMDGDDQLIGRNVFKTVNAMYQKTRSGLIFSQYFMYNMQKSLANKGPTVAHTAEEKEQNLYRETNFIASHLRTFLASLFKEIQVTDLQDQQGKFYFQAGDVAMMFPMLQMTCGRNEHINEFQYLYSIETGINTYSYNLKGQKRVEKQIRKKSQYPCSQQFLERIKDDSRW